MQYAILLQRRKDGKYEATVPLMPGLTKVGNSRQETLQEIQEAIQGVMTTTELVYVDISVAPETVAPNPWLTTAGLFADDETLEPMLHEIYKVRATEITD
ncbi:MAG: type II toxin-antitoxin system HicB family antitoxin [Anaerolineae bacterium]|nr:type II toxin-antitoxin system HicB family antitoxin [Anaerolineae bacterium]